MRKAYPIYFLMQNQRSRYGHQSVSMRVYIEHSYSEASPSTPCQSQKIGFWFGLLTAAIQQEARPTAGADWFDLPRTKLTPELKRDLQLIQLRSVLDPKRHYKKEDTRRTAPQFSQVGTILEGPTEFYSARLLQKDRKKTFVDEVLAGEKTSGRFKRKYSDIQAAKSSGKKAHYNELKARRASKA